MIDYLETIGYDPSSMLPPELAFVRSDLRRAGIAREAVFEALEALARDWDVRPVADRDLRVHPNPQIAAFCAALDRTAGGAYQVNDGGSAVRLVKWRTPSEELDGMARYVQAATRRVDEPLEAARICVVVPDHRWAALAERALVHRRFEVSMARARLGFRADPRDAAKADALAAYNRLRLLADPGDAAAWRVWEGLGQQDLGAAGWAGLVARSRELGTGVLDVLARLDDPDAFSGARELIARRDEALRMVEAKAGLKGYSLVDAIGAADLPEFEEAIERLESDDRAVQFLAKERGAFERPEFSAKRGSVRVATLQTLRSDGATFDLVWMLACVEGLMGPDDAGLFARAAARADRELVVSYFAQAAIETAEKAGISCVRRRVVDGETMGVVRPASFIADAGDACPGSTSGQALLAEL